MIDDEHFGIEEDFQLTSTSLNQQPTLNSFQQTIFALQELIIEEDFQNKQTGFMRTHCFSVSSNTECNGEIGQVFQKYCNQVSNCLTEAMNQKMAEFNLKEFTQQAHNRKSEIDDEIYQILMSLTDFDVFKQILLDYRAAHEEEERYKILTIKSSKIPEMKKVKGASENIFASSNEAFSKEKPLMMGKPKKQIKEKTVEELLIPEAVLTVKGLRKC